MTDILIENGSYEIPSGSTAPADAPWMVHFSGATDLLLPFRGTVVVPQTTEEEPDFEILGTHRWMFFSLLHPLPGPDGSRIFPSLRDYRNQPVTSNRPVIFLVADDHTYLDDVNFSQLFENISNFYAPKFKENLTISSIPRYLMIEFDATLFSGDTTLPDDALPVSRSKGLKLKNSTDTEVGLVALQDVLSDLSDLSGQIRAFDQAGRQTEAYSALMTLGIDKTISGAPTDSNTVRVQFVDLHGNVLAPVFPLDHLDFDPPLAGGSDFETNQFFTLTFSGDARKLSVTLNSPPTDIADGDFAYWYHFHYLALWPGYGFKFKEVASTTEALEIDLIKGFDPDEATQPTFVRICIFHPNREFQTVVGGDIVVDEYSDQLTGKLIKQLQFTDNKFLFFSAKNDVSIFTSGQTFFADYHKTVKNLVEHDVLYQANWEANPFLHLTGSMSLRQIEPTDQDGETINSQLQSVTEQSIVLSLTDTTDQAIVLPAQMNGGSLLEDPFVVEIRTNPEPGEREQLSHKGFVRPTHLFAWKLHLDTTITPPLQPHRVHAYWKNSADKVVDTILFEFLPETSPPAIVDITHGFPMSALTIEADDSVPAKLQIRRTLSMSDIRLAIGSIAPSIELQLLICNLASGFGMFFPLSPAGTDPTSDDLILTDPTLYPEETTERNGLELLLATFSAEDKLLMAIAETAVAEDEPLINILHTKPALFHFDADAIRTGNVPLHPEEVGGLLRGAIHRGVMVNALFWEQNLAEFKGGESLAKGLSNNEAITTILNRSIDGHRGFAFRDRSTRPFGSWHHKVTAIFEDEKSEDLVGPDPAKVLQTYLGGMDITKGRWDTLNHATKDPDRQRNPWFDIHVRIKGEATYSVIQNFKHRWKAIATFFSLSALADCRPVNTSPELVTAVTDPFRLPNPVLQDIKLPEGNAFVQINRTIPPFSCFSNPAVAAETEITVPEDTGELGSLASYRKAIEKANSFIIINDQYFFSQEIALLLHQRLIADDGPAFAIIVLPKDLAESEFIDPHLFKMRQLAIQTLYFGATDSSGSSGSRCGQIIPNSETTADVDCRSKVAILTPVNQDGKEIYVHSKHLIVDDVWMSIGSANLNNRSLTYDMEINAAIIGQTLFKGGSNLVRNHRIEIVRQLLGLPKAYSALVQEPYALFRLCKAIETQEDAFSYRLHPQWPGSKWLDVNYLKRVGDDAFNNEVDFVAGLEATDASFQFLACNLLDPDGRSRTPDRLGFLAALAGFGKTSPSATVNLTFNYGSTCDSEIRSRLGLSHILRLYVRVTITTTTPSGPISTGPIELESYLLFIAETTDNITLVDNPAGEIAVPISTIDSYLVHVTIHDEFDDSEICARDASFDPATASPPITHGSVRNQVITFA